MQESIIVYRNPVEKAIWEHPLPILVFIAVMAITFFLTYKGLEKVTGKNWKQPDWFVWVSGIVSITFAILALIYLPV
jgi:hypothetical protein